MYKNMYNMYKNLEFRMHYQQILPFYFLFINSNFKNIIL